MLKKLFTSVITLFFLCFQTYGQEICDNGIDDDNDGLIDLNDTTECNTCAPIILPTSLIPNSSFEDTLCCPNMISQMNCAADWIQASYPTPDYFNTCDNFTNIGFSPPPFPLPNNGNAYVGCYDGNSDAPWQEYVGANTNSTLFAGTSYTLFFYTAHGAGNFSPDLALYGTPNISDLPWLGLDCPIGFGSWVLLGETTINYNTISQWETATIVFTPSVNIESIVLGPDCIDLSTPIGTNYYYFDELILDSTANFGAYIKQNGSTCQNNLNLIAQVADSTGNWQWYLEGIALVGETNDTLITENYGAGNYSAIYTTPTNCIKTDKIVEASNVTASLVNLVHETCSGANNGQITIQDIEGSISNNYTITWTALPNTINSTNTINQDNFFTQTNLYTGDWLVSVENDLGCTWDSTFTIESLTPPINLNSNIGQPQCFNTPTGSIIASTNDQGNFTFTIQDSLGNTMNSPSTNTANALLPGVYNITIYNDLNCNNSITATLINPEPLNIDLDLSMPLCNNLETGYAIVDTIHNFQGDYDQIYYNWDPNPNGTNGLLKTTNNGLKAGEYVLQIEDEIGCIGSTTFFIINPNPLIGELSLISPTFCRTQNYQSGNGQVAVTTAPYSSGTGNVNYQWRNLSNNETSPYTTFVVTEPGLMEATLTDANGCIFIDTIKVDSINPIANFRLVSTQFTDPNIYEGTEVLELELINQSLNFSNSLSPLTDTIFKVNFYTNENPGGSSNWFFSYDYNEVLDTILNGEQIYEVCLVAKNYNNCTDTLCQTVKVFASPDFDSHIPNVFTPSADPNRTFYFPKKDGIIDFYCTVFDRYGIEMYRFYSIDDEWDGTNYRNQKPCSDGVYFFNYSATASNGSNFSGQGQVSLIRQK